MALYILDYVKLMNLTEALLQDGHISYSLGENPPLKLKTIPLYERKYQAAVRA